MSSNHRSLRPHGADSCFYSQTAYRDRNDFLAPGVHLPSEQWGTRIFSSVLPDASNVPVRHVINEIIGTVEGYLVTAQCTRCGGRSEVLVPFPPLTSKRRSEASAAVEQVTEQIKRATARIIYEWLPTHAGCDANPRTYTLAPKIAKLLEAEGGAAGADLETGGHVCGELKVLMADDRLMSVVVPKLPPAGTAEAYHQRAKIIHEMHAKIRHEVRRAGTEALAAVLVVEGSCSPAEDDSVQVEGLTVTVATRDCVLFGGAEILRPSGQRGVGPGFVQSIQLVPMVTPHTFFEGLLATRCERPAASASR